MHRLGIVVAGVALAFGALPLAPVHKVAALGCSSAGSTGLTAAMIVTTTPGAGIVLDATGCDIGIWVPPGSNNVTIDTAKVTGANDHGIFAEDVSNLTIKNSTIQGNGVAPHRTIAEDKAIELVGVSNTTVGPNNTVTGNLADGGIGIADDGPVDPGAPNPGTPTSATNDTVANNVSSNNFGGCGIVVASYNAGPGTGVSAIAVTGNTVAGSPGVFGPHGPVIGGVVAAADAPGASVSNVDLKANTITGAGIPGVVVHSNAPHDTVTGVTVEQNTFSGDDWLAANGPPVPAAVVIAASPIPPPVSPVLSGTTVTGNTISGEFYGVWISGATSTTVTSNSITTSPGGSAVFTTPAPGSGYTMVASDGGVFPFGQAGGYGSTGNVKLNKPIVGMAPTLDQGGYWLAAADGGVFPFGDAVGYGSLGNVRLNAPIVGIVATPYVSVAPPEQPASAGKGYWMVASDGGIFPFGDARGFGSLGNVKLNKPVVGMAATPDGLGYWLVASDGGVFPFGTATGNGSLGGVKLNQPIVGMAATPGGGGYWLVASDGGVFPFGDAHGFGSLGNVKLNKPVVGMAATPDGRGYWLCASDGGVFPFGTAAGFGSLGNVRLNQPIVGAAGVGLTFSA